MQKPDSEFPERLTAYISDAMSRDLERLRSSLRLDYDTKADKSKIVRAALSAAIAGFMTDKEESAFFYQLKELQ